MGQRKEFDSALCCWEFTLLKGVLLLGGVLKVGSGSPRGLGGHAGPQQSEKE